MPRRRRHLPPRRRRLPPRRHRRRRCPRRRHRLRRPPPPRHRRRPSRRCCRRPPSHPRHRCRRPRPHRCRRRPRRLRRRRRPRPRRRHPPPRRRHRLHPPRRRLPLAVAATCSYFRCVHASPTTFRQDPGRLVSSSSPRPCPAPLQVRPWRLNSCYGHREWAAAPRSSRAIGGGGSFSARVRRPAAGAAGHSRNLF